jgi:hypothetical protein
MLGGQSRAIAVGVPLKVSCYVQNTLISFKQIWDDDDVHLSLEQFKQWVNGEEPTPIADA